MTKARVNADNASADIQGVTAGTGLTGGGTSGTVTLNVDTTTIQTRVANVSDTEISYLDGVTSAIQTQIDSKASTSSVALKADKILTRTTQTGTSYTLALSDAYTMVTLTNAGAITLTVPPNSSVAFDIGAQINLLQGGAGQVTVVGGSGVTVVATPGLKLRAQWSSATLLKLTSDSWVLIGDLSA